MQCYSSDKILAPYLSDEITIFTNTSLGFDSGIATS